MNPSLRAAVAALLLTPLFASATVVYVRHWHAGDRGFLGLMVRDASGASASNIFYGFADITINANYSVALNGFAYENVRGAAITAFVPSAVPEPSGLAMLALGLVAVLGAVRRDPIARKG